MGADKPDIKKIIDTLSVCTLFSGLDKKALEEIAALSEIVRVSEGKMLFSDGDMAHAFYVVAEGRLRIFFMLREL
jgi:CRP-like cAMP-binding protein